AGFVPATYSELIAGRDRELHDDVGCERVDEQPERERADRRGPVRGCRWDERAEQSQALHDRDRLAAAVGERTCRWRAAQDREDVSRADVEIAHRTDRQHPARDGSSFDDGYRQYRYCKRVDLHIEARAKGGGQPLPAGCPAISAVEQEGNTREGDEHPLFCHTQRRWIERSAGDQAGHTGANQGDPVRRTETGEG